MAEHERVILRKVYVWRATLFGLLYGLLFGALFITTALGTIQYVSQAREIPTPWASGTDLVFFGAVFTLVFAFLSCVGIIIAVLMYNVIAKMGGALHLDLEERTGKFEDVFAVRAA